MIKFPEFSAFLFRKITHFFTRKNDAGRPQLLASPSLITTSPKSTAMTFSVAPAPARQAGVNKTNNHTITTGILGQETANHYSASDHTATANTTTSSTSITTNSTTTNNNNSRSTARLRLQLLSDAQPCLPRAVVPDSKNSTSINPNRISSIDASNHSNRSERSLGQPGLYLSQPSLLPNKNVNNQTLRACSSRPTVMSSRGAAAKADICRASTKINADTMNHNNSDKPNTHRGAGSTRSAAVPVRESSTAPMIIAGSMSGSKRGFYEFEGLTDSQAFESQSPSPIF
jgi:hypothetical protein